MFNMLQTTSLNSKNNQMLSPRKLATWRNNHLHLTVKPQSTFSQRNKLNPHHLPLNKTTVQGTLQYLKVKSSIKKKTPQVNNQPEMHHSLLMIRLMISHRVLSQEARLVLPSNQKITHLSPLILATKKRSKCQVERQGLKEYQVLEVDFNFQITQAWVIKIDSRPLNNKPISKWKITVTSWTLWSGSLVKLLVWSGLNKWEGNLELKVKSLSDYFEIEMITLIIGCRHSFDDLSEKKN